MTNFEKIKGMSVEEMAESLAVYADRECVNCKKCFMRNDCEYPVVPCDETMKEWLQQEITENETDTRTD